MEIFLHDADLLWTLAADAARRLVRTQIADRQQWWGSVTDLDHDGGPAATESDLVDIMSSAIFVAAVAADRQGATITSLEDVGMITARALAFTWLGGNSQTLTIAEKYRPWLGPVGDAAATVLARLTERHHDRASWQNLTEVASSMILGHVYQYDKERWVDATLRMCGSCTDFEPDLADLELVAVTVEFCKIRDHTLDLTSRLPIPPDNPAGREHHARWPDLSDITAVTGTARPATVFWAHDRTDPGRWEQLDLQVRPFTTSVFSFGVRLNTDTDPRLLRTLRNRLCLMAVVSHRRDHDDRRAVILSDRGA
ncbi:hypothetical protein ACFWPH_28575 [Nocardia sp. NPDC058499]|uniref:hypothetical protein n=1 Tax=Nocardia sp. NPDC058499 TaxID=3346530 RepID=UPI003666771C